MVFKSVIAKPGMGGFHICALFCFGLLIAGINTAEAQPPISIRVDSVTVAPDSDTVTIPIWLDNLSDTLACFSIWFQFSRPDLIKFEFSVDTIFDTTYWDCIGGFWPNCLDSALVSDTTLGYDFFIESFSTASNLPIDRAGTLIADKRSANAVTLGGQGFDTKVLWAAGVPSAQFPHGVLPQSGGMLIKLVANLLPFPDTLSDRKIGIHVIELSGQTSFCDPSGTTLSFQSVDGSVTILPSVCCDTPGDADNDGSFNIADVTFGIARIFSSGPAPVCQDEADANGDNSFNISDVTFGIARIFSSGPAPVCGTTGQ